MIHLTTNRLNRRTRDPIFCLTRRSLALKLTLRRRNCPFFRLGGVFLFLWFDIAITEPAATEPVARLGAHPYPDN